MSNTTIIKKVYHFLNENNWTQGATARNNLNQTIDIFSANACKWCVMGALNMCYNIKNRNKTRKNEALKKLQTIAYNMQIGLNSLSEKANSPEDVNIMMTNDSLDWKVVKLWIENAGI